MEIELLNALRELASKLEDFASNHAYHDGKNYELRDYAEGLKEAAGHLVKIIETQMEKAG